MKEFKQTVTSTTKTRLDPTMDLAAEALTMQQNSNKFNDICRFNNIFGTCANFATPNCYTCTTSDCKYIPKAPLNFQMPQQMYNQNIERVLTRRAELHLVYNDTDTKAHIIARTPMLLFKDSDTKPFGISLSRIKGMNKVVNSINPHLQVLCFYYDIHEVPYSSYDEYAKYEQGIIDASTDKILSAACEYGNSNENYDKLFNEKYDSELTIGEVLMIKQPDTEEDKTEAYQELHDVIAKAADKTTGADAKEYCVDMYEFLKEFIKKNNYNPLNHFTMKEFAEYCKNNICGFNWSSKNTSDFLLYNVNIGNLFKQPGKKAGDPITYYPNSNMYS